MLNPSDAFRLAWESLFFECPTVYSVSPLAGGSINRVYKVESSDGQFVMKLNSSARYPNLFSSEAKGLAILSEAKAISCAEVIGVCELETHQVLILNYIPSAEKNNNFFEDFGKQLAHLHQHSALYYGLDHDNYIGRLPQRNKKEISATDFFINQRLLPQLELTVAHQAITKDVRLKFDALFLKMDSLLPNESPSLIHGDLWSGNFIVGEDGKVVLIDPAVSYSSREADIAMTKLFGGFDESFYASYHQAFPLQPHWEKRIPLWNLYPLLVHVNLFGGSYVNDLKASLKHFGV
ncbi:MAG: fructosamine kinase family protein [Bacteroidetes bacterium]|nr:fructosamine kinase family protein [Bacteroidota bacterium]